MGRFHLLRQRVGLFHKFLPAPFAVGFDHFLGGGGFLRGLAFGLAFHQVGVSGEIIEALAFEIGERFKLVSGHEREQFFAHRLHAFVAEFHHARADLHGVRAQQNELRGVVAAFDAADAGERASGKFLADDLGDFHDHAQRDGLDAPCDEYPPGVV